MGQPGYSSYDKTFHGWTRLTISKVPNVTDMACFYAMDLLRSLFMLTSRRVKESSPL